MVLRNRLNNDDKALVDFIEDTDVTALEDMWETLDEYYGQDGDMADFHCKQLLDSLRHWKPCYNLKTLQELYNHLNKNYYAVARYQPSQIPMAEAVTLNISDLLFGTSQKRVLRLRRDKRKPFDMMAVLGIIKQHLADLRDMEETDVNNQQKGYKSGYSSQKDSSRNSRYDNHYNKGHDWTPSHGSRSSSRGSKFGGSGTNRSTSRESYQSQSNKDKYKVQTYAADVKPNDSSKSKKRSSTPLPPMNRGSRSKSPVRNKGDRWVETYKCTICLADDHDSFVCLKLNAEEKYRVCTERAPRLCFKCFVPGHSSNYCRYPDHCRSDKCRSDTLHHTSLCSRFKKKD